MMLVSITVSCQMWPPAPSALAPSREKLALQGVFCKGLEGSRSSFTLRPSTRVPGVDRIQSRRATLPSGGAHLAGNCTACGARRAYRHEGLEFGQAQDVRPDEDSEQHLDHDDGHAQSRARLRQQRSGHRHDEYDKHRVLAKHRSRTQRFVGKCRGAPAAPWPLPCSAVRRQPALAVKRFLINISS